MILTSFARWAIACAAASSAVTLQYGWRLGAVVALGVTAVWVAHAEVRR